MEPQSIQEGMMRVSDTFYQYMRLRTITRGGLFVCVLLLVSGCQYLSKYFPATAKPPIPVRAMHPVIQTRMLPDFSQVTVQGRLNVRLHTGAGKPHVVLQGDASDLAQVHTVMKGYTLCVSIGKGYPQRGSVTVEIYAKQLHRFTYDGVGVIRGTDLSTRYLDL